MRWHNLYLCYDNQQVTAEHLSQTLLEAGYRAYDPFDGVPGAAYREAKRLFVAPPHDGWIRVLGTVDDSLVGPLSTLGLCLSVVLDEQQAEFTAWQKGEQIDLEPALVGLLDAHHTPDDLHQALIHIPDAAETAQDDSPVPLELLPPDVQQMAQGLKTRQIDRLFNRMMKRIGKQVQRDDESAQELLRGDGPDWRSPAGQQIHAVMNGLILAPFWREPEFDILRDAYQNYRRRQRHPNAALYPGDAEAMAAVPDALDYIPVYGGQTV